MKRAHRALASVRRGTGATRDRDWSDRTVARGALPLKEVAVERLEQRGPERHLVGARNVTEITTGANNQGSGFLRMGQA